MFVFMVHSPLSAINRNHLI